VVAGHDYDSPAHLQFFTNVSTGKDVLAFDGADPLDVAAAPFGTRGVAFAPKP